MEYTNQQETERMKPAAERAVESGPENGLKTGMMKDPIAARVTQHVRGRRMERVLVEILDILSNYNVLGEKSY
jgi:hypothetical protein